MVPAACQGKPFLVDSKAGARGPRILPFNLEKHIRGEAKWEVQFLFRP